MARRLGAAPSKKSFGDFVAQAGARRSTKLVRSAGVAPASPDWRSGILLLNDDRTWTQRSWFRLRQRKEQDTIAISRLLSNRTRWNFTADLSVFQAHLPFSLCFFHLNLGNKKPCDLQGAQGVSGKILFEILKLAAHLLAVRDWGDKSRPSLDRDVARPSLAIRISRGNDAEMCFVLSLLYSKRVLS